MKKSLISCLLLLWFFGALAQRKCGIADERNAMIAQDASWIQKFENQRISLQSIADQYLQQHNSGGEHKSTTIPTIPVIFHIMVTNAQLARMGGMDGIQMRVDSQIAVLNRDYNRQNPDSLVIPDLWKPLYGNAGIHFGLAHTSPMGWNSPGYELKIIPDLPGGFNAGSGGNYGEAKYDSTGGLSAWDISKYINVWCYNFADASGYLGLTYAKSFTTATTRNQEGISIYYPALGCQDTGNTLFFPYGHSFRLGRTLTHEMGHYFEIWHTWGDDGFDECPWTALKRDDGIADTPPQGNSTAGNPVYSISGGTINDVCKDSMTVNMQPIGYACLDFMDYTDDSGMHLFTPMQAAVMASMVLPGGQSYSLTQHPELLQYPANTGIAGVKGDFNFIISPNPTTGLICVSSSQKIQKLELYNAIGQEIRQTPTPGQQENYYSIDLSGFSKGIYFLRCNFASGSVISKVLLQ